MHNGLEWCYGYYVMLNGPFEQSGTSVFEEKDASGKSLLVIEESSSKLLVKR